MRISTAVIAAGLMGLSLLAQGGQLKENLDRFTGTRSVTWSTLPSGPEQFAFSTSVYIPEKGEPVYILQLFTYADISRYQTCHFVDWLVDGRRAPELQAEYGSDSAGSASIERFTITADRKTLENLSSAKSLEYKVCNDEGAVLAEDLNGLRQVLAATK
ncbi:hypothetical protein MXM82_11005 [Pseudomonas asiatica]|uniref:hypothetical protein n=1 Tax=Pseudomonas asiatica TaxID=2219225 RepID=UPI002DB5DBFA|nr:hypothetical protein [Pseudomonas asiatica]MEB6589657.1 hypothetical protein [Pseudomonas asiatica]